jgi:hypothetical protein
MVPMTWDINSPNQNGTKGTMTIIDRSRLSVFGTYAMEGINEIYPRPSEDGISTSTIAPSAGEAMYNLQGMRVDEPRQLDKGVYIRQGKKFVIR